MFKIASGEAYAAFRRILIEERKKQGLTQWDVALRLGGGITQSDISKIERGERRLDVAEFIAYIRAMGSDPHTVFGKVEKVYPRSGARKRRR